MVITKIAASLGKAKQDKKERVCKWFELGACWDHGQVERDPDYVNPNKKEKKKKGAATAQPGKKVKKTQLKQQQQQQQQQPSQGDNPKSQLNAFVTKKTGEAVSKEDIVYTVSENDDKQNPWVAEVTIMNIDPALAHTGKVAASKKQAEANAARKALGHYGQPGPKKNKGQAQPQQMPANMQQIMALLKKGGNGNNVANMMKQLLSQQQPQGGKKKGGKKKKAA